ncbi:hypothetical protein DVP42_23435, partial [Yersinia enterocolitica]|nr:hypothetical protein [Yersinia enterocolitica]
MFILPTIAMLIAPFRWGFFISEILYYLFFCWIFHVRTSNTVRWGCCCLSGDYIRLNVSRGNPSRGGLFAGW